MKSQEKKESPNLEMWIIFRGTKDDLEQSNFILQNLKVVIANSEFHKGEETL